MEEDNNTILTQAQKDEEMVQTAYQRLVETYLASPHRKKVDLISKAFNFARKAHEGVRRLSGEPYIMHPLAVAQIVCGEIGLGSTSICAALLHDVVEDTEYTVEDLNNVFGPKIAQIVDGLTKISGGIFGDKASAQAESFKKLLLTMSDDIRVILIKISDRLHNMRTLGSQPPHKQYKIAGETLYIYAPLAHRLGLNRIKEELEDLSFEYEHPEAHAEISQRLDEIRPHLDEAFKTFIQPIREKLDKLGYTYDIKARVKRPYSVWNKMQTKHVAFEEIYDLLAVRIIFDSHDPDDKDVENADCMQIYSACTGCSFEEIEREFASAGYGVFKPAVGEAVVETLRPIREEAGRIMKDKGYLDTLCKNGAEKASYIANKTLRKVYKKVGLVAR